MIEKFNDISAFLVETDWNARFTLTFSDVCRSFDADINQMDKLFYDTFGMSADEVIDQYRHGKMNLIE